VLAVARESLKLWCPFEEAINPNVAQAQYATTVWAQRFGLVPSTQAASRFERFRFATLMARAYPNAPLPALQVIADFNSWAFLIDDYNERQLGCDPAMLTRFHSRLMTVLDGGTTADHEAPFFRALSDLSVRLRAVRDDRWMARFRRCVDDTLRASRWEALNRVAFRVPTERQYKLMRPYTSGVYCYLPLIELAEQMTLPDEVYYHPTIQRIARAANHVICWSNDIISFAREHAYNDVHNLVIVIQNQRRASLNHAISVVAEHHDAAVQTFLRLRSQIPRFGRSVDGYVQQYVQGMAYWMRANMDWSAETMRYVTLH
jgi:5-epi-alpha-selinene synthase